MTTKMSKAELVKYSSTSHTFDLTEDFDCLHQYRTYSHRSTTECSASCDYDEDENICLQKFCCVCYNNI